MRKLMMALIVVLSMLCSTVFSSAADSSVVLVNPASYSTVSSNNLLISVKLTEPKKIIVTVFEEKQMVNGTLSAVNINSLTTSNGSVNTASIQSTLAMPATSFTSSNNLSFYTKQINVSPGLYRIRIQILDETGKVTDTKNSYVAVKEKTTETDAKVLETPQSGTMQFLQNLLKTIFGD